MFTALAILMFYCTNSISSLFYHHLISILRLFHFQFTSNALLLHLYSTSILSLFHLYSITAHAINPPGMRLRESTKYFTEEFNAHVAPALLSGFEGALPVAVSVIQPLHEMNKQALQLQFGATFDGLYRAHQSDFLDPLAQLLDGRDELLSLSQADLVTTDMVQSEIRSR